MSYTGKIDFTCIRHDAILCATGKIDTCIRHDGILCARGKIDTCIRQDAILCATGIKSIPV